MEKKKTSTRNLVAIYLSIAACVIMTFINISPYFKDDSSSARNESSPKKEVNAESEAIDETEATEETTIYVYNPGEAVPIENAIYTVTNVQLKDEVAGYTSESGTFIVVDINVQNDGNEAVTVNNNHFNVVLNDAVYENHPQATAYHEGGFFLKEVNPGLSTSNSLVYEIPKVKTDIYLYIQPNKFKDDAAYVLLAQ